MKRRDYLREVERLCVALAEGTLTPERVDLAALLGDPIAHEVSERTGPCPRLGRLGMHGGAAHRELRRWVRGLAAAGRPAVLRAAIAVVDLERTYAAAVGAWAHGASREAPVHQPRCVCDGYELVRQALQAWVRCPCDEHAVAPRGLAAILPPREADLRPAAFAELFDAAASPEQLARRLGFALQTSCDGWAAHPHRLGWCFGADEVQLAIRDALLPWALGRGDPALGPAPARARRLKTQLWLEDRLLVELAGGEVMGRDASCDVPVDDPTVSGRHVRFEGRDGRVWVRDLGSTNGTRIELLGGHWCDAGQGSLLQDGRRLRLGTLELDVHVVLAA